MKELIKDRIDVLMDSANKGNTNAQLKLARCFYEGHLVEKSIDNALYWSFKAISSDNDTAIRYFEAISAGNILPLSESMQKIEKVSHIIEKVPIWEIIIGIACFYIMSQIDIQSLFILWIAVTGFLSLFGSFIVKKIYNRFVKRGKIDLSSSITIIIIHFILIYITIGLLE